MKHDYPDIRELTNAAPLWWDRNGTPRYRKFHPDLCPSIYAEQVGLFEIECQNCSARFLVEDHSDIPPDPFGLDPLAMRVADDWHWGDPPHHGCMGDSMNSVPRRVVEFWRTRDMETRIMGKWARVSALEFVIPTPDWMKDGAL